MTARDGFLQRVRSAVQAGNRPGQGAPIRDRANVGYQGAGTNAVECFLNAFAAAGGTPHVAGNTSFAAEMILTLIKERASRRVLIGKDRLVDQLALPEQLRAANIEPVCIDSLREDTSRAAFFDTDIAVSGVDYLIAETGSVVMCSRPTSPRSGSLLPPVHIAIADRSQIVPDLFDLFAMVQPGSTVDPERFTLPSCISLITGPSKTGDIELRLVTGVHGPGEIHVVLITS